MCTESLPCARPYSRHKHTAMNKTENVPALWMSHSSGAIIQVPSEGVVSKIGGGGCVASMQAGPEVVRSHPCVLNNLEEGIDYKSMVIGPNEIIYIG